MTSTTDALAGSLLGLCLGDALGTPVEARHHRQAARYAAGLRAGWLPSIARDSYPFGQYTDDGQLARELLISVRDAGRFEAGAFAGRLASLVDADRLIGAGPGTIGAARRILAGVPWDRAGAPPPYSGNGAAMRVGPLGVLLFGKAAFQSAIRDQSRVTHLDPRCAAGAIAIATCAGTAARDADGEPADWLESAAGFASQEDPAFGTAVRGVGEWLDREPPDAALEFRRWGLDHAEAGRPWRGVSSDVTASVCWALYCALRHPDDYMAAVTTAIWAGGDTDTTAAMAGAMVGARVGVSGLPEGALQRLNDRGEWGAGQLAILAGEVAAAVESG